MRITESQLRRIVREESRVMAESSMLRDAQTLSKTSYALSDAISLARAALETGALDPGSQGLGEEVIRKMEEFSERCSAESESLRKSERWSP